MATFCFHRDPQKLFLFGFRLKVTGLILMEIMYGGGSQSYQGFQTSGFIILGMLHLVLFEPLVLSWVPIILDQL
jgi:hypothetical protein